MSEQKTKTPEELVEAIYANCQITVEIWGYHLKEKQAVLEQNPHFFFSHEKYAREAAKVHVAQRILASKSENGHKASLANILDHAKDEVFRFFTWGSSSDHVSSLFNKFVAEEWGRIYAEYDRRRA